MARTDADQVKAILDDNYGRRADGQLPDLTPRIRQANLVVNRLATRAAEKGVTLTSDELTEIETYVAAYLYTVADPLYTARSTAGASGSWAERSYLDPAYMLDASGSLRGIIFGVRAGATWLGSAESEQTTYDERNR